MKSIVLILFCSLCLTGLTQTKIDSKFGKGIFNVVAADSSWSMKFAARFQTLFIGTSSVNDSLGVQDFGSQFLIRRARLKFDGFAFSPRLKYKMELGLSNRDISLPSSSIGAKNSSNTSRMILDAVLKYNFAGNWEIWAGQTKLPGNRERVISSGNLQFVDRSQLNSKYNIDRDMGVQLRHHITLGKNFIIKEMISVSQGEGRNITAVNLGGYDWTGRIELLPFGKFQSKGDYVSAAVKREEKPKLAIGVTYDYHDRAVRENGNTKDFMTNDVGYFETDIKTIFVDAMFKYQGIAFMAEYADKKADAPIAINSDGSATGDKVYAGTGLNLALGYMFKSNWETAVRYTQITPIKEIGSVNFSEYTFGVSKYVVGHKLKVQSDITYRDNEIGDDGLMYRMQFDLHF